MRLILWSPPEITGFGGGGGAGSRGTGVGVGVRLPAQGLMESTAEAQLDFSAFLSPGPDDPDAGVAMLYRLCGRECHAREAPREDQLLGETRFACLLGTRLKVSSSLLCEEANVGGSGGV